MASYDIDRDCRLPAPFCASLGRIARSAVVGRRRPPRPIFHRADDGRRPRLSPVGAGLYALELVANTACFGFQFSRPLLYAVYYFAGLGVGAYGLERGLLAADGLLARRWGRWFAGAIASFLLWMGLTANTDDELPRPYSVLQLGADASFALAGASGCFFVMAACLRFGAVRSRLFASLSNNAFGMYLLHYIFVVWLQYALLGLALLAIAKAMIVLCGALVLAWGATAALRFSRLGSRLIGEAPGLLASAPGRPQRVAL